MDSKTLRKANIAQHHGNIEVKVEVIWFSLSAHAVSNCQINLLCLVTNEGQLKRLLLLYKRIMQPYLSLFWL